jgi:hypothetical protein
VNAIKASDAWIGLSNKKVIWIVIVKTLSLLKGLF